MWTHSRSSGRRGANGSGVGALRSDAMLDSADTESDNEADVNPPLAPVGDSQLDTDHFPTIPASVQAPPPYRPPTPVPPTPLGSPPIQGSEVNGGAEVKRDPSSPLVDALDRERESDARHWGAESASDLPEGNAGSASEPVAQRPRQNPMGFDIDALRESMAMIKDRMDELGERFYATLFAVAPETREMFPAGMDVQRSRLVGALVHIVGAADDRDDVTSYLEGLGRDHRKFGVIDQHYAPLGSALILSLREVLADRWTTRYENAWVQAYDTMAMTMSAAARRDAVIAPPWWDAEVVYHRRILDDMAVIQVRPHTDYPYRPGQYAYLSTPRRAKIWRAYSMASAPREDGLLEFHVKAVGAGWVSSALVWRTEPGEVLHIGAPQGHDIATPRSEHDLLCIAGGTGIAPILATLQELEQRQDGRRVHVFYAGRDRDHLYALPHLESIGVRYRRLTVVPVVSPEGPTDRSPDLMGNIVSAYGDWRRHRVYVAGPSGMVVTSLDRLREQGVPEDRIVFDDYGLW